MNAKRLLYTCAVALLVGAPAAAQDPDDAEIRRQMHEAEERLAEAARQIAELSTRRLPDRTRIERHVEIIDDGRPRLGVTIAGDDGHGPVEGVVVIAVTPGSAASDAGLRSGDTLTSINGESLGAADSEAANRKLLDFMAGIETGDVLEIEYLRAGKVGKVEVEPRPVDVNVFAFLDDGRRPGWRAPEAIGRLRDHFAHLWHDDSWGGMELVELNEGLGKYFGTDEGLLVVSAPKSADLKLEDGDVIQKIDGRTPTSVRHAMRILGSYQPGEKLKLDIMRDKRRRTLDVEMPAAQSSRLFPEHAPPAGPAHAPRPPRPEIDIEQT